MVLHAWIYYIYVVSIRTCMMRSAVHLRSDDNAEFGICGPDPPTLSVAILAMMQVLYSSIWVSVMTSLTSTRCRYNTPATRSFLCEAVQFLPIIVEKLQGDLRVQKIPHAVQYLRILSASLGCGVLPVKPRQTYVLRHES